jgi:hypothetical protein
MDNPGKSWRLLARRAGVTLAVLALPLLFPAAGRAGCGDHAVILPEVVDSPAPRPHPVDNPKPCSGPTCGEAPRPLPLVPVSVPAPVSEKAAWSEPPSAVRDTGLSASLADGPSLKPCHRADPLEPPPR